MNSKFTIWVDADACPKIIKEHIFKEAMRLNIKVCLVANSYITIPLNPLISMIKVDKGFDVADSYIADHVAIEDLVITADIPLAAIIVEKGAIAINPRGELYTEDNVSERLSMRDFMKDLRDAGLVQGGPSTIGGKDKEHFANSLNKLLAKKLK